MSQKKKNFWITMGIITMCSLLSFGLGIKYQDTRIKEEKETYDITQNMIAVVNADEGTMVNGSKVNYAAEFMSFPDVNFILTGLTDARTGVSEGRYAAYVIIPGNFSQAITSINREPEKASIVYEIGDYLRTDVREEVSEDIQNFITGLGTNVSYVYVDSIMREFHTAQDGAKVVLNNDERELESVNAIDYDSLIEVFLLPETQRKEWELETIDFSSYYDEVNRTTEKIGSDYEAYLAEGKLAFDQLNQEREIVSTAVLNLTDTMDSIDIEYRYVDKENNVENTVSQNTVYGKGLEDLRNYSWQWRTELMTSKNQMGELVIGNGSDGFVWEEKPKDKSAGLMDVAISLSSNQINLEKDIGEIRKSEISVSINSVRPNSSEYTHISQSEFDRHYMVVERRQFEKLESDVENLNRTAWVLDDARKNLIASIDKIDAEPEKKVQSIITNEIVRPIESNIEEESARLRGSEREAQQQIEGFWRRVLDYDPLEYVKEEEIEQNLLLIQEEMGEMETIIDESNLEYFEFVSDVYDLSDENYEKLLEEVEITNNQTAENVSSVIEQTKQERQKKNEVNSQLLNDFTQKLNYTRIGNLENKAVNEFIVSPFEISDADMMQTSISIDNKKQNWKLGVGILGGIVFVMVISRIFYLYITKEERRGNDEAGL